MMWFVAKKYGNLKEELLHNLEEIPHGKSIKVDPDKVDMCQMFEIFVDLLIPFKVDTCIYSINYVAKRYLRAKRAKNYRSF